MKYFSVFVTLCSLLIHCNIYAQVAETGKFPKIGYTNIDIVLSQLPESKKMQSELQVTKAQLEKSIDESMKEFQSKLDIYQKLGPQMTDIIRADKEKELENLQGRIQQMRGNAHQSLQTKQQQLLEPIYTKINTALQEVGKENAFTYIFNMDSGPSTNPFILFASSDEQNVTNLVLKKLGVNPEK